MSYHGLNLDKGKASKSVLKLALRFEPVALRFEPFCSRKLKFTYFYYEFDFSLLMDDFTDVIDDMACKCHHEIVLEGRFIS